MTKHIFKSGLTALMALSLSFCGSADSGTGGVSIEYIEVDGQQFSISTPEIEATRSGNDITLTLTVEVQEHFSHFEIEKKVGTNGVFEFLADETDGQYEDMSLSSGTYRYRAKAVYLIDGEYHLSNLSDEAVKSITLIYDEVDHTSK